MSKERTVGIKIRKAREGAGMSRPDVYRILGIPVRTQEGWESGERVPSEWLETLVIREYERIGAHKEEDIE